MYMILKSVIRITVLSPVLLLKISRKIGYARSAVLRKMNLPLSDRLIKLFFCKTKALSGYDKTALHFRSAVFLTHYIFQERLWRSCPVTLGDRGSPSARILPGYPAMKGVSSSALPFRISSSKSKENSSLPTVRSSVLLSLLSLAEPSP